MTTFKYNVDKDIIELRNSCFQVYHDEPTGGLRVFNRLNEELNLNEVKELIEGLSKAYMSISEEEYRKRTLNQIYYDVDLTFEECSIGEPIKKLFRTDLQRHYTINCTNCLNKIPTKTEEGYWVAQSYHKQIYGKKFCSEWCVDKYINEVKQKTVKEKIAKYGF